MCSSIYDLLKCFNNLQRVKIIHKLNFLIKLTVETFYFIFKKSIIQTTILVIQIQYKFSINNKIVFHSLKGSERDSCSEQRVPFNVKCVQGYLDSVSFASFLCPFFFLVFFCDFILVGEVEGLPYLHCRGIVWTLTSVSGVLFVRHMRIIRTSGGGSFCVCRIAFCRL